MLALSVKCRRNVFRIKIISVKKHQDRNKRVLRLNRGKRYIMDKTGTSVKNFVVCDRALSEHIFPFGDFK